MKRLLSLVAVFLIQFLTAQEQQFELSGTVTDENNQPFPGVSIIIKGTKQGTTTDFEGNYALTLVKGNYVLQFNYLAPEPYEKEVYVSKNTVLNVQLGNREFALDEVLVSATRVTSKTPIAFTNISKEQLQSINLGQDLPIIIDQLPSVVTTSDAGTGIGYTGIRVRGTDATRVNVTINGIPYNDAESQGTFWVNMPDFVSSVDDIQLQRGVGTSTNGAAAFGATLNLKTNKPSSESYATIINSFGSFGTNRHNVQIGTGLKNGLYAEARLSKIQSDGYIDRATSDLKSFYVEGGYLNERTAIKAIVFGGQERTYQSWFGTPESRVNGSAADIQAYIDRNFLSDEEAENLLNSGRTYNFYTYENQVDNYNQDHYQLHATHQFNSKLSGNLSLNYTNGRGFFEQFREDDDLGDYFPDSTNPDESGDVVRRRWLDNDFYALVYSLNYNTEGLTANFGGSFTRYDGDHFGEVISDTFPSPLPTGSQYYFSNGDKRDINIYAKAEYNINDALLAFGDLQYRTVNYETFGTSSDLLPIAVDQNFGFFNPKMGLSYAFDKSQTVYGSFSVGNREPNRDDLINNPNAKREQLFDWEFGYRLQKSKIAFNANFYFMDYKDQLVLTGAIDDTGGPIRQNVDRSYRAGIELQATYKASEKWTFSANTTLSQNKIKEFDYLIFDTQFDPATFDTVSFLPVTTNLEDTDIAFSPNIIAGSVISYQPIEQVKLSVLSKYVGDQFLDNTSSESKKIDSYFVNNFNASWTLKPGWVKELRFDLLVNNFLNELYESNGYTFSYFFRPEGSNDPAITENFLYPQAGTNFLVGMTLKF
ncbi:TonB-dependent receptor [Spongiivirga citrea]|uniref:TonB-dependent receptor n=1 Tax=Spongiivirga citrea TaxID=1481457 RepID=A0A6M0CHK3_9FLAO|nr:TonB-dependent receptor [Spongiivirga citrea]NER16992.1 TonB-dependent receptor [Spongiivirga citrea]